MIMMLADLVLHGVQEPARLPAEAHDAALLGAAWLSKLTALHLVLRALAQLPGDARDARPSGVARCLCLAFTF